MRELRVSYMPYRPRHSFRKRRHIQGSFDATKVAAEVIGAEVVEVFLTILLDVRGGLLGICEVGRGSIDGVSAKPRDVFRTAILANAASVVVAHNHPSGDPYPSDHDISLTRRLAQAGEVMCIPLLDHLIIGQERHYSFVHAGLMPRSL